MRLGWKKITSFELFAMKKIGEKERKLGGK